MSRVFWFRCDTCGKIRQPAQPLDFIPRICAGCDPARPRFMPKDRELDKRLHGWRPIEGRASIVEPVHVDELHAALRDAFGSRARVFHVEHDPEADYRSGGGAEPDFSDVEAQISPVEIPSEARARFQVLQHEAYQQGVFVSAFFDRLHRLKVRA